MAEAETKRVLIVIADYNDTLNKSTRNLKSGGIELRFAPNFSVRDVLTAHKIVLVKEAIAKMEAVWAPSTPAETTAETEEVTA